MAVVLAVAALALGRAFFIPIALALCFQALLTPAVRGLGRLRIPAPAGAAIVVLGALAVLVVGGWALSGPASEWVDQAPANIATARRKLRELGRPLDWLTAAAEGTPAVNPPAAAPNAPAPPTPPPAQSLFAQLLGRATTVVAGLLEVIVLVYLMLAAGSMLFRKLVKLLPAPDDLRTATDILNRTELIVANYLTVTALINVGQGLAVGLAMWAIGMPDPFIWGVVTFVLEFIPYLGGAIIVGLLLIDGFSVFPGLGRVLLAPAIYLVISMLQNNVVSPYVYGNRLKLNPLAVMIFVLFWWFIWGIPGVFLAIPIAATLKVLGDQVPGLSPLGELLGE
ncbi:MAG TPA: AI-2E family transporter [Gemmatimonadales bacterium]|nr:AI-2E family transporter [Gemmatimonadales bacterium]